MDNQQAPVALPTKEPFNFSNFLQFRQMITLQIIPILYVIVAIIITLLSLVMMFSGGGGGYDGGFGGPMSMMPGGFLGGLFFLVLGNIFWRMWCEFILVLFRINKNTQDIETNTRRAI